MTTIEHQDHPAVYAREVSFTLAEPRSGSDWESRLDNFLTGLVKSLRQAGCSLIGHIKGVLETGEDSRLFFSLTTFQGPPHYKGQLSGSSSHGCLTINVIVYGVDVDILEGAVNEGIARQFGKK
jgi:hypothetical protein